MDFKTPQELWIGRSPNITYIRVFECTAYVHQSKGKIKLRATKCVMLDYLERVKGYMLWVLGKPGIKIINNRDVAFNEFEMPCLKHKTDKCVELRNEKGVQSEVKLTKFNLS